jgi:hypothetical protein
MKRKNNLIKFMAVLVCLLSMASAVTAQKRRAARKPSARPVSQVLTTPAGNLFQIRESSKKASDQLKNVTRFIYLLGSIAQGIEDVDNDIRSRRASQAVIDLNTRNKEGVIAAVKKLRADLVPLEIEFRAKPALRNYVPQIGGISDLAANAEEQARSGQFKEAGRTLLRIVERLSDTLAAMP